MIQRRNSLAYIEFIRGKYDVNKILLKGSKKQKNNSDKSSEITTKNDLIKLFQSMSPSEIEDISELNFDKLWDNLWKKTSRNKIFKKEYENSKSNFENLVKTGLINDLIKIKPLYDGPEWGFPKGRRNLFEKNLECALREFNEETGIENDNIFLINKINCIIEEYTGSNNVNYKHIYYLALSNNSEKITMEDIDKLESNYEVGNIGWYSWEEASEMIRGHYTEKIKVLNQIYFLFLNLYIDYMSSFQIDTKNNETVLKLT